MPRPLPFSLHAVGWLLPWALQQLSRGDKQCPGAAAAEQLSGELRTQQQSAWRLDRQTRRRRRLHTALMADDQLKVLLMEQQWWAQRGEGFEEHCESCSCAPSDLRPAYDCTGGRSCLLHAPAAGSSSCPPACVPAWLQHRAAPASCHLRPCSFPCRRRGLAVVARRQQLRLCGGALCTPPE